MSTLMNLRPFTADEYQQMGRAGILRAEDRVELIEGRILTMSPIGNHHVACVDRCNEVLVTRLARRAIVRVQGSVRLDFLSEPEPDLVLLAPQVDYYWNRAAGPEDILLIIEVADSSLRFDREIKGPFYARHGIPEYWLIDVKSLRLSIFSAPVDGSYSQEREVSAGLSFHPACFPDIVLTLADLLG